VRNDARSALRVEKGSKESILIRAGPLDAPGRPHVKAMPLRSTNLSDGPMRPYQEHGAPVLREDTNALYSSAS
jgi:hypothetical protein